jgi:hypothetical protein
MAHTKNGIPFVITGAELSRQGGKVTFDAILEKYGLSDPALHALALIVREADIRGDASVSPEAPGFRAILHGFFLLNMPDSDTLKRLWCKLPVVVPFQPTDELRAVRWPGSRAWTSCLRVGTLIVRS